MKSCGKWNAPFLRKKRATIFLQGAGMIATQGAELGLYAWYENSAYLFAMPLSTKNDDFAETGSGQI